MLHCACATFCNHIICRYAAFPEAQRLASPSYAAAAEVAMCSYSSCVQGNERIGFFCDLMKKNAYWTEFAAEYIGKGISFASFRADVFKQAQSAFLFAIAIAQIGKRCLPSTLPHSIFVTLWQATGCASSRTRRACLSAA